MFQGFRIIILILGWLCLPAFFIIIDTLFQNVVRESREIAEESPSRSFWLGLVNGIFLLALISLFIFLNENIQSPLIALPGLIFLVVFIIGAIFGLTSMILLLSELIFPTHPPTRKRIYGAIVMILGCTTPIIGWYGLLPYLLFVGFGAFVTRTYNRFRESRVKHTEGS